MMDLRLHILSAALLSLLLTVVAGRLLLPVLYKRRAAQPILEIGPAWHLSKKGTPTLGGLFFIIGVSATLLLYAAVTGGDTAASLCLLLAFALLSGAIGLLDDICKLTKRENQGLSAAQKFFLQLLVASLFLLVARMRGIVDTAIYLPFVQSPISLGVLYYPLMLLYLTGLENALNLTDGLDGLLGTTAAVMGACFILLGLLTGAQLLLFTGAAIHGCCASWRNAWLPFLQPSPGQGIYGGYRLAFSRCACGGRRAACQIARYGAACRRRVRV